MDTQSAFLYRGNNNPEAGGEPPVNVHVFRSHNLTFTDCTFSRLGGVYGLGVDGGSQGVVVSNSTFTDISGGGIKLGYSGERGVPQPQNNESFAVALQDRGFLISVQQLRHHFGPFSAHFSAPAHPARAVCRALLGAHADRGLIRVWNPML